MWVDLSHNRIAELTTDLGELENLKTLYLHVNYISDFGELEKLKKATLLRILTIHANPL
jgi:Leucine-rich repeat (LRR) protein